MGIKNPSEEVIQAVEAAIAWFNNSKIEVFELNVFHCREKIS